MTEQELTELLTQDYSAGTEAFRDELLERCLAVIRSQDASPLPADAPRQADLLEFELDDAHLGLLAAAGDAARPYGDAGSAEGEA